jgi:hypothetical protein
MNRVAVRQSERRALIGVFTIVLLAHLSPLLFGLQPLGLDNTRGDLGQLCAAEVAWREGQPWLSRVIGTGAPFAAEPGSVVFYPPRWLQWLIEPGMARMLSVALHFAWGAAGVVFLARRFRVRVPYAVMAALTWSSLGPVVDLVLHSELYVAGAAWFPWLWGASRQLLRRPTVLRASLVMAIAAAAELSGDAQGVAIGGVVCAIDALVLLIRRRVDVFQVLVAGAAGVAGVLVGFLQTSLVVGELALSGRGNGLTATEALSGALELSHWPATVGGVGPELYTWLAAPFLCGSIVVLALMGVASGRVAAVMGVALLWMSLGADGGLTPLMMKLVPQLLALRYPAKYLPFAAVGLCIAAAEVIMLSRRGSYRRWAVIAVGCGSLVVVGADIGHGAATAAVAVALAFNMRSLASVMVIVQTTWMAIVFFPLGPAVLAMPSLVNDALPANAVLCVGVDIAATTLPILGDLRAQKAAAWRAYGVPGLNACDHRQTGMAYQTLQSGLGRQLEHALDMVGPGGPTALGCSHILRKENAGWLIPFPSELDAVAAAGPGRPRLYTVPSQQPMVWFMAQPQLCSDEECALESVFAYGSTTMNKAIPLLSMVDDPLHRLQQPLPSGQGYTTITRDDFDNLDVTVTGTGGGVVVIRRPFLVGWTASQAGRPLTVVRAAAHHIGVVVEDVSAGPVLMVYRPPGLWRGIIAAIIGMVVSVVLLIILRRRRQSSAIRRPPTWMLH